MMRKLYNITFLSIAVLSILSMHTSAASYNLEPSSGDYILECTYETKIFIDTDNQNSNSADITILYDPTEIEILDQNINIAGIQVSPGDAYEDYVFNQVDAINGTIKIVAASYTTPLNGSELFATIQFKSLISPQNSSFEIKFLGPSNTLDSNIAENISSTDILTDTTDAYYTFIAGECGPDIVPPQIIFVYPNNNQQSVEEDAEIIIRITDTSAGIDIDSLQIFLNDILYDNQSLEVTYDGDINEYQIRLIPSELISQTESSILKVVIQDLNGNESIRTINFNSSIPNLPETGTTPVPRSESVTITEIVAEIITEVKDFMDSQPATIIEIVPAVATTLLATVSYSRSTLYAIAWLKRKKKKQKWGLIFDLDKQIPIPFATVRIYKNGQFYKQEITNIKGQYGLLLNQGKYMLEIAHPDYVNITKTIKIVDTEARFGEDIGLNSIESTGEDINIWSALLNKYKTNISSINSIIFIFGLLFSIVASLAHPILFNYLVVGFYAIQFIFIVLKSQAKNDWGYIYDSTDQARISGAIIKIFSSNENRQLEAIMSDLKGRYTFKADKNDTYLLLVSASGYAFPSINEPTNNISNNRAGAKMIKVHQIIRGNISQNIAIDKLQQSQGNPIVSSSPFSN